MINLSNLAIIYGNMKAAPEMRFTSSGTAVLNFDLAVNVRRKTDGEYAKETEWYTCVAWGTMAEFLNEHTQKGTMLLVLAERKTEKWTPEDGGPVRTSYKYTVQQANILSRGVWEGQEQEGSESYSQEDAPF